MQASPAPSHTRAHVRTGITIQMLSLLPSANKAGKRQAIETPPRVQRHSRPIMLARLPASQSSPHEPLGLCYLHNSINGRQLGCEAAVQLGVHELI